MIFWKIFTRGRGFVAYEWVCTIGVRWRPSFSEEWQMAIEKIAADQDLQASLLAERNAILRIK
jgi:hypothetical protein